MKGLIPTASIVKQTINVLFIIIIIFVLHTARCGTRAEREKFMNEDRFEWRVPGDICVCTKLNFSVPVPEWSLTN